MCILNFVPSKKIVDNLHILDRFLRGWNNFAIKKGVRKFAIPSFFSIKKIAKQRAAPGTFDRPSTQLISFDI